MILIFLLCFSDYFITVFYKESYAHHIIPCLCELKPIFKLGPFILFKGFGTKLKYQNIANTAGRMTKEHHSHLVADIKNIEHTLQKQINLTVDDMAVS